LLELRNIRAGYDTGKVLENVSLVVPKGSVVALLGPNGAGKTTLLRVASGLLAPSAGQVIFDGEDMTGTSAYAMANAGLCHVPEGRGIFPTLSVADNLRLQAPASTDRQALDRIAPIFPILQQRRRQLAGTLSGGEQQMLALSRALGTNPTLLMLDELSMGLAPLIVSQMYETVGELAAQGLSILVAEQFARTVLPFAHAAAIMLHGRIVRAGSPAEIEAELSTHYLGG
jgi:branched-chain amino acid transport system ATP-binding protein